MVGFTVLTGFNAVRADFTLSPTIDATINRQNPDANYGGLGAVQIRANPTAAWKGYIRFDLSSVPLSQVDSMALTLSATNSNGTTVGTWANQTVSVYALHDVSWGEGTGNSTSSPLTDTSGSTITWNHAPSNDTASNSGFDSSAVLLASFNANGTSGAYTITLDAAALDTLMASTTGSITFLLSTTGTTAMNVGSRTAATSFRPSLFVAVPEPGTAGLLCGIAGALALRRRRAFQDASTSAG